MNTKLTDLEIAELKRLMADAWPAPWRAHTFEIDCPCPNGEDCGDSHSCAEVEAPEAYPSSAEAPAEVGSGQCVVQITVPGLESLAGPCAAFIAAVRNALPSMLDEIEASRASGSSAPRSGVLSQPDDGEACAACGARGLHWCPRGPQGGQTAPSSAEGHADDPGAEAEVARLRVALEVAADGLRSAAKYLRYGLAFAFAEQVEIDEKHARERLSSRSGGGNTSKGE